MDFVFDADSFSTSNNSDDAPLNILPIPSAPLKIPTFQIQNDLTKRLSNLSILKDINKSLINRQPNVESKSTPNAIALKQARASLELISTQTISSSNQDTSLLSQIFSRVMNSSNYDSSIRQSLTILQKKLDYSDHHYDQKNNELGYMPYITSTGQLGSLARRNLRGLIEEDLLRQQSQSLKKFQPIVNNLLKIESDLKILLKTYDDLILNLNNTINKSKDLQTEINDLSNAKNIVNVQRDLLISFKNNFTLNHYEEHFIQSGDVSEEYFRIVGKIKKIQLNCEILLGMDNDNLGMSILVQMSKFLNIFNDRVLNYLQKNIDVIYNSQKTPESISTFQKSIVYILESNKEGFAQLLSKIIDSRSRSISEEFVNQLKGYTDEITENGKSDVNNSKGKLFMSSYDTTRFISDTLAYIHSILVNEIETATSLLTFDLPETSKNSIKDNGDDDGLDNGLDNAIETLVTKIMKSLGKPLRGAVESVLRQESKLSVLVKVYGLIELYIMMFGKLLHDRDGDEGLLSIMEFILGETRERVLGLIGIKFKTVSTEAREEGIDPEDIGILPDWIVEWCSFVGGLFEDKNSSSDQGVFLGMNDIQRGSLECLLVDKPLNLMKDILNVQIGLSKKEKEIWEINCSEYLLSRFEIFKELKVKNNELEMKLKGLVNNLIQLEFDEFLKSSGLFDIFNLVNMICKLDEEFFEVSIYEPIVENKLFTLDTFKEANIKLQHFLTNYITSNELNKLMSPTIFNDVFFISSFKFVKFYHKLLQIVNEYLKDENGQPVQVFQWDDYHVATLIGIEDYYLENK